MRANRGYLLFHWTARILALLIAGTIFTFFLGEAHRPLTLGNLISPGISLREGAPLALVLGAALAMLLAWIWERWAGAADVLLGATFLLSCFIVRGMQKVWVLGVLLMIPGALYLWASALRGQRHTPTA